MIISLVNGKPDASIDVQDRGFAYGDGAFRTFRMRGGVACDWARHFCKLERDSSALALSCPSKNTWQRDLTVIAKQASDCVVKLMVTRGTGPRGYQMPPPGAPTRVALAFESPPDLPGDQRDALRARICHLRLARQPRLAGIKHLNRLENVLARAEWNDPDIGEGLLFDSLEQLVGGTASNVFLIRGGRLFTPDLAGAGVAGVQRARIIEAAAKLNVELRVGCITREELVSAEAVFVCNSVVGIRGIAQLDEQLFPPHPLVRALRAELDDAQL